MIPYIILFIDKQPHSHGLQTLTWALVQKGPTSAKFTTSSPFSDVVTRCLIKTMLTQCLTWLSPMVKGEAIEVGFTLTANLSQGFLRNVNGKTSEMCHCPHHLLQSSVQAQIPQFGSGPNTTFQARSTMERAAENHVARTMLGNETEVPYQQSYTAFPDPTLFAES